MYILSTNVLIEWSSGMTDMEQIESNLYEHHEDCIDSTRTYMIYVRIYSKSNNMGKPGFFEVTWFF